MQHRYHGNQGWVACSTCADLACCGTTGKCFRVLWCWGCCMCWNGHLSCCPVFEQPASTRLQLEAVLGVHHYLIMMGVLLPGACSCVGAPIKRQSLRALWCVASAFTCTMQSFFLCMCVNYSVYSLSSSHTLCLPLPSFDHGVSQHPCPLVVWLCCLPVCDGARKSCKSWLGSVPSTQS